MQVDARTIRRYAVAIVCVLLLASPAAAQFDRGTISGVVKDQSGGIVPGVTVTVKSLQTQELPTAVTDASGYLHDADAAARALRRRRRARRASRRPAGPA